MLSSAAKPPWLTVMVPPGAIEFGEIVHAVAALAGLGFVKKIRLIVKKEKKRVNNKNLIFFIRILVFHLAG